MITHDDAIKIFESNNKEKICDVMLHLAVDDEDWVWVQNQCLKLLDHEDIDISGLAAICLGHIARTEGKFELKTIEILNSRKYDTGIGERVQTAL